mgnify:CR=1 FL=1
MTFTVPIKTVSALNVREHWAVRARRVKSERQSVYVMALAERLVNRTPNGCRLAVTLPVTVTLTRISHRRLDAHDNLRAACKGVADEITALLGLKTDADERVEWRYRQSSEGKGVYGVRVTVESRGT